MYFVPCQFALVTVHNIYWQWHVRNGNETQQHSAPVRPSHHVPTMRTDRLRILSCAWRGKTKIRGTRLFPSAFATRELKKRQDLVALYKCPILLPVPALGTAQVPRPSCMVPRTHGQSGHESTFGSGWYSWPTDSCSNKDAGRRDCKTPTPCNELQAGHSRAKRECKGSLRWRSVVWLTGPSFSLCFSFFFVSVRACIWVKHSQAPVQPHSSKVRHL